MTETADIVIVGGGCIGAAIALHLAEKQAGKILLLEKADLAHGASGKGTGIIRTHYTHPVLAELAHRSLQLFHAFGDRFGGYDVGFHPCGYFVLVGEEEADTLRQVTAMHQSLGINVQLVDPQMAQEQVPFLRINDVALASYEPDSGFGSPPLTTLAFAKRALDLGVEVRTQTPVTAIRQDAEGRVDAVETPQGAIATRTVVDCVGPWAKQFTEHLGLSFPITSVLEHVLVLERPAPYTTCHPVISDLVSLIHFRSDHDQPLTRVGNSDPRWHRDLTLADAETFQGQVLDDPVDKLTQRMMYRCPGLQEATLADTYTGIWALTPDYQPIIDRLDHIPGLYCAVGFSGHGYKLSPVLGDLVSRLVLGMQDERTELLKLFRYDRFQTNDLIKSPVTYSKAGGVR
jgi:glycine/D-amino acid oxidase-like deaminating enzyme